MKRKLLWLISLIILFILSYYREVTFRSVNAMIDGEVAFYAKTTYIPLLAEWNAKQLIQLKYLLTLLFSLLFMGISLVGFKNSFNSGLPFHLLLALYGLLLIIMLLIGVTGTVFFDFKSVYPILRKIVGMIHSPLLYLLFSIGFLAYSQIKKNFQ